MRSLVQDRDMKTMTLAQETEKFQKLSDNVIKLQVCVRLLGFLLEEEFLALDVIDLFQKYMGANTSQTFDKMELFFYAGRVGFF